MRKILGFLKPTSIKLVFLVEWGLFLGIELLRGRLEGGHPLLVALAPLLLFYLAACGLFAAAEKFPRIASGWKLPGLALGMVLIDQTSKMLVLACIPYEATVPVIRGWLNLAHVYNLHGSWLTATFALDFIGTGLLAVSAGGISVGAVFGYLFYTSRYRQSLWADAAFLGVFGGGLSWFADFILRGYIVDYINLPGVVTADFKDLLLWLGAASFFAEGLDNPQVSFRWKGWRQEGAALKQFAANFARFFKDEIRRIYTKVGLG